MVRRRIGFACLLAAGALPAQSPQPVDLLPDAALHGWTRIPIPPVDGLKPGMQWKVDTVEHTLVCSGDGGHEWLRYDTELGDFIFQVDWRFTPRGEGEKRYNSGVGARLSKYGEVWYQAQTSLSGGYLFGENVVDGLIQRFNLSKEMKENRVKPAGEWNHYEIRAQGSTLTLAVNGVTVNELPNCGLRRGYIGLEAEGYEITFRNLKLQDLQPAPTGKLAPRPLYRDPVFDAPTDPVFCFNAEQHKWFMYYTARRATAADAPGVTWIHGSNIGMAESSDGGATWTYRGIAGIDYGKDAHPHDYTYWAPEVIWHEGTYHMFLTYVPGIFNDWNHPREIVHLTSKDGVQWDAIGPVDLKSDRVIDPCVMQLPGGGWRMWYKDERKPMALSYADSPDLNRWEPQGNAVTDHNGEGPKVFHWQGKYWLVADTWATGMRVWSSVDCLHWEPQEETLGGSHGDVVVSGGRAWWFSFSSRRAASRRSTAINVVELSVVNGKLIPGDPDQPAYIDLKPEREAER